MINKFETTAARQGSAQQIGGKQIMYDYLEQVTADVRDYVEQEIDLTEWAGDRDGLEEKIK